MAGSPPFTFKNSILTPLYIDPNLLQGFEESDIGYRELKGISRAYKEKLNEIESIKTARRIRRREGRSEQTPKISRQHSDASRVMKLESLKVQEERSRKLQEMMTFCEGLTDFKAAKFYLDAQNWDLDGAITFYCECTGMQDLRRFSKITLNFEMPNGVSFSAQFDDSQVLWSILPEIYNNLAEQREFKVSRIRGGEAFSEERMTTLTFRSSGIANNSTLYVEYL